MSSTRQLAFSLTFVLIFVSIGNAQRGRGFGLASRVDLVAAEPVQNELKLNDDQKQKAEDIRQAWRQGLREVFESQGQGASPEDTREKMQKVSQDARSKLKELLDDSQRTRLQEIFVQVNGVRAIDDADVAETLSISDEQKEQLRDVNRRMFASMREAWQDLQGASREERRERMVKFRDEVAEQVAGLLTNEQKEKLETMKGDSFEFDLSQLRRRRN